MKDPVVLQGILHRHCRSSLATLFLVILCTVAFVLARLLDSSSNFPGNYSPKSIFAGITFPKYPLLHDPWKNPKRNPIEIPMTCSHTNSTVQITCPTSYYPLKFSKSDENLDSDPDPDPDAALQPTCPDYFRWIHEDLWPWRETGITLGMVEAAKRTASFRLVVVNGTVYVETYRRSFQTRDVFTQWGILQLLRLYPGRLPDLDMIISCADQPTVVKQFYPNPNASAPPALFSYDGDDATFDIVFPDWSFWGWPEIAIKPWEQLSKDLKEGNERMQWVDKEPQAYWKGNAKLTLSRKDLLRCNVSGKQDWNARIYQQDWHSEERQDFKNSNLANQCIHRFKIYIEGFGWSVSQKYILACDSVTLMVKPRYYEFFSRSLIPLQHYWPIRDINKCRSIKYAVEWGNNHQEEAQAIGKAASRFVQEELQMKYVYDYMFHLLKEYAKLLKYKPSVPPNAIEVCSESMACPADGLVKKYMMDSVVTGPSNEAPCTMPPPYGPATFHSILERKESRIRQAETLEEQYRNSQNNHK
ncbi:uncharacterized protein [Coffea arabica]|uniref:Glycosyl transferase CAP10 domain-containing protein n=1 Tax=Coffea arabica TaxID=13443 RepID=A0A6P6TWT0_COFAR|nr:O-glucosyltransferase rumi homolog [Coffea arabica]